METTVGQLLVNEALPEDLRDYNRVLDKKTTAKLLAEVAEKYPDKYGEVSDALHRLGSEVSTSKGREASVSLDSLRTPDAVRKLHNELIGKVQKVLAGPGDSKAKHEQIVQAVSSYIDPITEANYEEGLKEKNPLALQVASGSRGNKHQFRSLRGGDLLVSDHKDNPVPIPILASFSEGLDPVQYWAGAYGARKGSVATKFSTPKAGFLGKQLALAAHRIMVTEKDCGTANGLPVPASDPDNEGAVLARDAGGFKAGTVLTPKLLKQLGDANVVVRSPMTCRAEKGICQHCAGKRERGGFSPIGENIGLAAAQAVSEPLGQGMLSEKHTGGQVQRGRGNKAGFDLINQLVQVPEHFQGAAALAETDGRVDTIEPAPQGGQYVHVGGIQHWVPPHEELSVQKGDTVEAGDLLSSGIPNPAQLVHYKGIGEGRRYFVEQLRKTMAESKFPAHRRNLEVLSRGLINHVRVTDLDGPADTVPDDIVEYDDLVRGYTPRFGFKTVAPKQALGLYLEEPVLHYSIGTKVTPNVSKVLEGHKVDSFKVHADSPSFAPEMTRAMETISHSDDWMVRLGGFHLKKGLTEAVHRGRTSSLHGTSFIPSLAQGTEFGTKGIGY